MSIDGDLSYLCTFMEGSLQACDRILAGSIDETTERAFTAIRTDLAAVARRIFQESSERREWQR